MIAFNRHLIFFLGVHYCFVVEIGKVSVAEHSAVVGLFQSFLLCIIDLMGFGFGDCEYCHSRLCARGEYLVCYKRMMNL